ncbi:MAG TPA: DUF5013 domain-containing protein [Pedobacter sp.]|nr:DUF5013 domain-containing protein [Pedobacter sp.]
MKKAFRPLLILFSACLLFACSDSDNVIEEQVTDQKRPLATFEVTPGDDPFTFNFKNNSTDFKSIEWRFGDDSLSVEDDPSHVFLSDGKFEVTLTATAPDGSTAKKVQVIEIDPEKVAKITAKTFGPGADNKVKFTAASEATIASVKWDFGDGSAVSNDLSPVHQYDPAKLVTATATVVTDKGSTVVVNKLVSSSGTLVEIISNYLVNVGPKFIASQRVGGRWGVVADWRVNDAVKQREGGMGGWDEWEGNSMSMESWGSEPDIVNGKIEQTSLVPVPAGTYYYELKFHDYSSKDQLYSVAAKGNNLPDVGNIENNPANVLGFTKILGSATNGPAIYTKFVNPATQFVTFGFVATFLQPDQNFKLTTIRLYKQDE